MYSIIGTNIWAKIKNLIIMVRFFYVIIELKHTIFIFIYGTARDFNKHIVDVNTQYLIFNGKITQEPPSARRTSVNNPIFVSIPRCPFFNVIWNI